MVWQVYPSPPFSIQNIGSARVQQEAAAIGDTGALNPGPVSGKPRAMTGINDSHELEPVNGNAPRSGALKWSSHVTCVAKHGDTC